MNNFKYIVSYHLFKIKTKFKLTTNKILDVPNNDILNLNSLKTLNETLDSNKNKLEEEKEYQIKNESSLGGIFDSKNTQQNNIVK